MENSLFPEEKPKRDNQFEWDQFCKLGEMIGDGLHNEPFEYVVGWIAECCESVKNFNNGI